MTPNVETWGQKKTGKRLGYGSGSRAIWLIRYKRMSLFSRNDSLRRNQFVVNLDIVQLTLSSNEFHLEILLLVFSKHLSFRLGIGERSFDRPCISEKSRPK